MGPLPELHAAGFSLALPVLAHGGGHSADAHVRALVSIPRRELYWRVSGSVDRFRLILIVRFHADGFAMPGAAGFFAA